MSSPEKIERLLNYFETNTYYIGHTFDDEFIDSAELIGHEIGTNYNMLLVRDNFIIGVDPNYIDNNYYNDDEINSKVHSEIHDIIKKYLPIKIIPNCNSPDEYDIDRGPNHLIYVNRQSDGTYYAAITVIFKYNEGLVELARSH